LSNADADRPPAPPAFPDSLCLRCRHHRAVRTKTSTFVMCTALPVKYPRQPVVVCAAYEDGDEDEDG